MEPRSDLTDSARPFVRTASLQTRLIACQSTATGEWQFPAADQGSEGATRIGPDGVLYTYTVIHVSSVREVPYILGYIDFPEGLRVLAHVRGNVNALCCDMPVRLHSDEQQWWVEPVTEEFGP